MSGSPHTGNELQLMLRGKKPLAMFYEDASVCAGPSTVPEAEFDAFVEQQLFIKGTRIFVLSKDPRTDRDIEVRYVLYALAKEEWRIAAMFTVLETMVTMGRADEGIDRVIGALLGYDIVDIDAFIRARHREPSVGS